VLIAVGIEHGGVHLLDQPANPGDPHRGKRSGGGEAEAARRKWSSLR
jgi:hypothetical protein